MIVNIYITYFLLFLVVLIVIKNKLKKEFFFSLTNLFLLFALAEIPYLYYLNSNTELIHPYVKSHISNYELVFAKHILLKILFICVTLFSMSIFKPRARLFTSLFTIDRYSKGKLFITSIILFMLTLVVFYLFLNKIGGLAFLLLNMSNKTLVVQGTGLYRNLFLLTSMLSLGFYINYLTKLKKIHIRNLLIFFLLAIICFLILAASGERKNPILILFYCILMWNYKINKIKIFTLKNLILFSLVLIFSALAPVLRKSGAGEFYSNNPLLLLEDSLPYLGELFKRFSEIDTSLFIYSTFDNYDKFWWGASIGDFFTGFIPSGLYPDKPPLDEGVYIYALAHNYDVTPPTPFNQMLPVGWPLSRVTGGYVHFGTLGVVLNAFIVGAILKYFDVLLVSSNYSPQAMVMFAILLATNFGITNAFIANNLVIFVIMIIISIILTVIFKRNKH